MLELGLHLVNTQQILKQEWFHGKHILESNKVLDYDGPRAEMKFNIIKSYDLLHKAIDSMKKNVLDLQSAEILMPTISCIDHEEYSVGSY